MINCNRSKRNKTEEVSSNCDKKFYSFFANFLINKEFQISRTKIENWTFINLYPDKEYTLELFEAESTVLDENDNDLINEKHLTYLSLSDSIVTDYVFKKTDCNWSLSEKNNIPLSKFVGREFLVFMKEFSTDSSFMKEHINYPLKYEFLGDDYTKKTRYINSQDEFKNNFFDKGYILILNSGKYSRLNNFKIAVRGIGNGVSMDSFFEMKNGAWKLIEESDFSD
jgi:hypothetical protein